MGPGGSQEAEFVLLADVPAGTYKLVCDAIIIRSVDVTLEILHRRNGVDVELARWERHFDPLGAGMFDAQACDLEADAPAIVREPGDELIFRYSGANTTASMAFIPNGDGEHANGRIPNITLPQ